MNKVNGVIGVFLKEQKNWGTRHNFFLVQTVPQLREPASRLSWAAINIFTYARLLSLILQSHLSTQLSSRHRESHSCQSYRRMKGLLRWCRRLSSLGAMPPDASEHKNHWRELKATLTIFSPTSSDNQQRSLYSNLIIGLWIAWDHAHERTGKVWRLMKPLSRLFVLFLETVNLLKQTGIEQEEAVESD